MVYEEHGALDKYREQIDKIGAAVNDLDLFKNIQEACLKKQAFLLSDSGSFAVLAFQNTALFLWVTFSLRKAGTVPHLALMESMGRDFGATHLEFWSIRKGLLKILPPLGWDHIYSEWHGTPIIVWSKTL